MSSTTDPYAWIESVRVIEPSRPCLIGPDGRRRSYAQVDAAAARYAAALAGCGVNAGDRVLVQVDKSVAAVYLYLSCLRLGAVYVPVNTANTAHEVAYFLEDSSPRAAIVRPEDRASLQSAAAAAGVAHLETLDASGGGSLERLAVEIATPSPRARLDASALAAIVYTSGTTGRAKGAMLTRGNLASNASTLARAWDFTKDDVLLHALPLFHVHGLFAAINTVLAAGASLELLAAFDAHLVLERMRGASVFMGVPTHYTRLLRLDGLDRKSTAGMRLFVSGSAPLPAETHREFGERTGHAILERYGMTETLMNTSNPYDGPRVPGAVGPPLPGIELRVIDPQTGLPLSGPDAVGALEVRGPNVCAGYWRDAAKTASEFTSDGWFRTGDLGRVDAAGYVHIVGRAKDLVITGGYNVYPKEIEAELDRLPGVAESAVIGVAHPDFGEGVTAVVVPRPGAVLAEAVLIQEVRARVAGYKVPKRVLIVESLPRNAMGKVQKNVLRSTYASLYLER